MPGNTARFTNTSLVIMAEQKNATATKADTAPANPYTLKSLADLISKKEYLELSDERRDLYDQAFAEFKQAHVTKYPNGQRINLPIVRMNWDIKRPEYLVIVVGDTPNTYTPIYRMKEGQADVMFANAIGGMTAESMVLGTALCEDKGSISLVVHLVDTSDTYTDNKTGTEEYFTAPQATAMPKTNTEYVPSVEVKAEFRDIIRKATADRISGSFGRSRKAAAAPAPAPAPAFDDDDTDLLGGQ